MKKQIVGGYLSIKIKKKGPFWNPSYIEITSNLNNNHTDYYSLIIVIVEMNMKLRMKIMMTTKQIKITMLIMDVFACPRKTELRQTNSAGSSFIPIWCLGSTKYPNPNSIAEKYPHCHNKCRRTKNKKR